MGYKTSGQLIELQKDFWDQDFYEEGDVIGDMYYEALENIKLPDPYVVDLIENSIEDQHRIQELKKVMVEGSLPPIFLDSKGFVIDGYHRYYAAKELKLATVPCIRLSRSNF